MTKTFRLFIIEKTADKIELTKRKYETPEFDVNLEIIKTSRLNLGNINKDCDILIDSEYDICDDSTEAALGIVKGKTAELIQVLLDQIYSLENSKEELDCILDSASEGILAGDMAGNIKYVNPAHSKITGIPPEQRIGKNIFEQNNNGVLATVLKTQKPVPTTLTRAPGSKCEVVITGSPVMKDNKMVGAVVVINDVSETVRLAREVERGKDILKELYSQIGGAKYTFADIVAESESMKNTLLVAFKAGQSASNVLITGESGTGKELFAQAIHSSSRPSQPFIAVNCAAIPENLLEGELFGHEKGAFTGATVRKMGLFELAQNGTLFLDEIGDLNYHLQAKLLRVLQEREFRRVGGVEPIPFRARLISATNRNFQKMFEQGLFREDLYYRLNVIAIAVPPLRQRRDDLQILIDVLLKKINRKTGKKVAGVDKDTLAVMSQYHWPGNVRELENILERAINMCEEEFITSRDLESYIYKRFGEEETFSLALMEKKQIKKAVAFYGPTLKGKKSAAKALGISLSSLYQKLSQYEQEEKGLQ